MADMDKTIELMEELLKEIKERKTPVRPIKKVQSTSHSEFIGVDGVLLVGDCPVCGQGHLNNRDNKFCGGCGRPVIWERIV